MTTVRESLVFGGLELNDLAGDYVLIDGSFSIGQPAKQQEWAKSADADGAELVRDPTSDNRTISFDVRINRVVTTPAATMDDVLGCIAALSAKIEEAERQPDGLGLVWTPANGATSTTFDVLTGSVDDVPITVTGDGKGWFRKYPRVKVTLTAKPFGRLPEVAGPSVTTSNPVAVLTVPSVAGEVPALGRLVVTDAASQSRRSLEWGVQNRYYDAGTSLELDSGSLVTSGFAGSVTTRSGSHNTNVVRGSLLAQPIAVAGTGNLGHVGTFRVKARVFTTSPTATMRLSWQDGDGPFRSNGWASAPVTAEWAEVDLGTITITAAQAGTQKWSGRLEAMDTAGGTVDFDYLLFIPAAEGYGKGRAIFQAGAGAVVATDSFTGMTAAAALNTRVAPAGGTWATSGATGDFVASSTPADHTSGSGMALKRTGTDTGQGRIAILGSTTHTDTEVGVYVQTSIPDATTMGVVARYVDASNYVRGYISVVGVFEIVTRVGGSEITIASESTASSFYRGYLSWLGIKLVVFASGTAVLSALDTNGNEVQRVTGTSSALATGGALASGIAGIQDNNAGFSGVIRSYDDFYVAIPPAEPAVIYPGQSAEIRHDCAIREDATGTYYGTIPTYRGDRFRLQPAGDAGRTSRILVKARRNDTDTAADDHIADSTTVQVFYTPRIVTVPHT